MVSTGSEDDISKACTLDANLHARSIPIAVADILLYQVTLQETRLKINTSNILY
jgi:hypothetical protein